jgi:hypothetical protein
MPSIVTQDFLAKHPTLAELRAQVEPPLLEEWENNFSHIIVFSTKITDSKIIVNNSLYIDCLGDREEAEKFVLYLMAKPKE